MEKHTHSIITWLLWHLRTYLVRLEQISVVVAQTAAAPLTTAGSGRARGCSLAAL